MSGKTQLPQVSTIEELLSDIFGEEIEVKAVEGKSRLINDVTATFVDADGAIVGACLLNLALAACLGAALVRIPVEAAVEAATAKKLSGMLRDAMYEVLNITAQLFRASGVRHRVVLSEVYIPGQPVPDNVAALLKRPTSDIKVEITIPRYTKGMLTFLAVSAP